MEKNVIHIELFKEPVLGNNNDNKQANNGYLSNWEVSVKVVNTFKLGVILDNEVHFISLNITIGIEFELINPLVT